MVVGRWKFLFEINLFYLHVNKIRSIFQYGSYRYEDVERTKVKCDVLKGIECYGNTTFYRDGFPCIKYDIVILGHCS